MSDSEESVEVKVKLPVKEKKPRTEKQIAAQQKAFAVLKEKREQKAKQVKEEKDKAEVNKDKWRELKKKAPAEELVTKKDLEGFMSEVRGFMKPQVVEKIVEKPVERIVEKPVERVIERVVERPPPAQPEKLSGHALLDKLFFNK